MKPVDQAIDLITVLGNVRRKKRAVRPIDLNAGINRCIRLGPDRRSRPKERKSNANEQRKGRNAMSNQWTPPNSHYGSGSRTTT